MNLRKKLFTMAALAGVVMGLTANVAFASTTYSSTSVSLYRPFPNGIDQNNLQHALQQVEGRATWDASYAQTIAQQAGRPSYVASEFRAMGYAPHASVGTTNSGVTSGGKVVAVADHGGSQYVKVFEMINIVSQKTVELMVRCGNPRLKPSVSIVVIPWKPFSKGTVIRFNRRVSKPVSITCPSGQKVSGTLTTTVSGFARATTWGKVQGSLNLKLREKIKIQVKSWVSLHCGPAPPAPTPPPPPPVQTFAATATATATASATCPDGTTATASSSGSGSASSTVSQADADQKAKAQAQANAQASANASVKCGSTPPSTCPSGTSGTPPNCVTPLQAPTVLSITTLNDVTTTQCRTDVQVMYNVPAGQSGTLTITAGPGNITTQNVFNVTAGQGTQSFTYCAPSEVPASGTDTITATLITQGGKDSKTSTFRIIAPETTPKG
jgi:hypothetical protein